MSLLGTVRRRLLAGGVALLVIAGAVLGVTDPFATSQAGQGVHDNSYPTATRLVSERSLTSQTEVSATLGYAGSYTISLPSGTASSQVASEQQALRQAEEQLSSDEAVLSAARGRGSAVALIDDETAVTTDKKALAGARRQLRTDERLGCPAASSATVTTASGNANGGTTGTTGSSGGGPSATGTTGSGGTGTGDSGTGGGTGTSGSSARSQAMQPSATAKPVVSTGSATASDTSVVLSGTVMAPAGASYYFSWGSSKALSHSTPTRRLGPTRGQSSVTAKVSGLRPDTTYAFRLVAENAAGSTKGGVQVFQTAASSCTVEAGVVRADKTALTTARDVLSAARSGSVLTLNQDEQKVSADEAAVSAARQAATAAESAQANPGSTFTRLPAVGEVIRRGDPLYWLDEHPVPLFYGDVVPYRALYLGVASGPDVAELQRNLRALGFGSGLVANGVFTSETAQAVKAWQASIGVTANGVVALGSYAIAPGAVQVDTLAASDGALAQPGSPVLTATSQRPVVTIALDASQQSEVKVGDPVVITLPNNSTTPGIVTSVGKVATSSSGGAGSTGSSGSATISVIVTPSEPSAVTGLDQAPVEVSITTASVANALVVPVDALVALAGGGYAIEVVEASGAHQLVAVTTGLFDDAAGLVQVKGAGVKVGEKVVVPRP